MKKQTQRRLARASTAISLTITAAWIGSTWFSAWVVPPAAFHQIELQGGEITAIRDLRAATPSRPWEFGLQRTPPISSHFTWFKRLHFASPTTEIYYIPIWPFILATGVPLARVLIAMRLRRHKPGMCGRCGYDLSGLNAAGGVTCPECGARARKEADAVS